MFAFKKTKKQQNETHKTHESQKIINKRNNRSPITTIDSKDDILSRDLTNRKDICILLDCSDEVHQKKYLKK